MEAKWNLIELFRNNEITLEELEEYLVKEEPYSREYEFSNFYEKFPFEGNLWNLRVTFPGGGYGMWLEEIEEYVG